MADPHAGLLAPSHTYETVTEKISAMVLKPGFQKGWLIAIAISGSVALLLPFSIFWLLYKGIGVWGINIPVGWGWDIINFVWWIGIGHAGTLISAILFLLNQGWRTSINRFAEAMTLFAVMCAGLYPLLHTGRPWLDYWLTPIPNTMNLWPQFRSPLVWDVFAVSTYGTVSLVFWYVGLIPDLGTIRDRAKGFFAKRVFGIFALGWRGSVRHWQRYQIAYLLLAGLSTPLVLSVHTIVSYDFAVSVLPGWHTTIFPPYFVAGAVYSGFAMVMTFMLPMRWYFNMKDFITDKHIDMMCKVMLATGLIVAYGYSMEAFFAFYSGTEFERFLWLNRATGPYWWSYWALILTNVLIPQLLWSKKIRSNSYWVWALTIVINIGMWLERFVIIVTATHRDFVPSSWGMYYPTKWDVMMFVGTIGFFSTMMLLFMRFVPFIAIAEVREMIHHRLTHSKKDGHH
jgi:Ni/Fe-hydrogenase subunit HybB-like protein